MIVEKWDSTVRVSPQRNLVGQVQLSCWIGPVHIILPIPEQEAISLCDQLRVILINPTIMEPTGENVVVMDLELNPETRNV